MKRAETQAAEALNHFETFGKSALETAQQKAKDFGQQSERMTAISQEARNIADNLESNATQIVTKSKQAEEKANEAYELATNITGQEKNTSRVIEELKASVINTELKLKKVSDAVSDAHNRSADAKERALELLSEVNNLDVPDVDIAKLKAEAESTRAAAVKLIEDTDDLIDANNELLNDLQNQISTAKELLDDGFHQNDKLGRIMNEILATKAQAENAVGLGDTTLTEAKNTYEKLSRKYRKQNQNSAFVLFNFVFVRIR